MDGQQPVATLCMACDDESCDWKPLRMQRRPLGEHDILIDMKYCGVCHSDLHRAANHMKGVGRPTEYPCVAGHELAGVCAGVGASVTKFKVGDQVGVGCLVDACLECDMCRKGEEQKCKRSVGTYQGLDWSGRAASYPAGSSKTLGGYTSRMVVHERFAIKIPPTYPLDKAGPVFCAGITLYDPLVAHGAKKGTRVGVVGLGGLGIMGVKLAKALGCVVTAISRAPSKRGLALTNAGADFFVASSDGAAMAAAAGSLDLVLNTIPSQHDYRTYEALVDLSNPAARHVVLGANATFAALLTMPKMLLGRKPLRTVHSGIGGLTRTQAAIDLCAAAGIYPETELLPVSRLAHAYEQLDARNDAGVRYVLDIGGSLNDATLEAMASKAGRPPPPKLAPNSTGFTYAAVGVEIVRLASSTWW